jgi:hypothetical protein
MLPYADQSWMENYPLSGIAGRFHPQDELSEQREP